MFKHAIVLTAMLAACGESAAPTPHEAPAAPAPAMPAGHDVPAPAAAKAPMDQMFIDMMVPHHQGAVDMAKIAQERAEHPELKAMASAIITAQQAEIDQLKGWRKAWFGSDQVPPMDAAAHANMPGMHGMASMQADIEKLKTATPFDLAFLDAMIPHHQGAVDMVAAMPGERPEIKELAAKIVADQKKEIAQMREWRKAWYPEAAPAPTTH